MSSFSQIFFDEILEDGMECGMPRNAQSETIRRIKYVSKKILIVQVGDMSSFKLH